MENQVEEITTPYDHTNSDSHVACGLEGINTDVLASVLEGLKSYKDKSQFSISKLVEAVEKSMPKRAIAFVLVNTFVESFMKQQIDQNPGLAAILMAAMKEEKK